MTVTPAIVITQMPEAPARLTDTPEEFVQKADAWLAAWPTFRDELNTQAAGVSPATPSTARIVRARCRTSEASASVSLTQRPNRTSGGVRTRRTDANTPAAAPSRSDSATATPTMSGGGDSYCETSCAASNRLSCASARFSACSFIRAADSSVVIRSSSRRCIARLD